MALTECAECGGKVSDKAASCPHCGAPVQLDEIPCSECGAKILRQGTDLPEVRRSERGDGSVGRTDASC